MLLFEVKDAFLLLPRLAFLTLRGKKGNARQQTIGWANDFCRRLSDHWFVVREADVVGTGYHFHALISVRLEKLTATYFRKGIHTNIRYLSDHIQAKVTGQSCVQFGIEAEDQQMYEYGLRLFNVEGVQDLTSKQRAMIKEVIKSRTKTRILESKIAKEADIDRVLNYMMKCNPRDQYVSYILNVNHKARILQSETPPGGERTEDLSEEAPALRVPDSGQLTPRESGEVAP